MNLRKSLLIFLVLSCTGCAQPTPKSTTCSLNSDKIKLSAVQDQVTQIEISTEIDLQELNVQEEDLLIEAMRQEYDKQLEGYALKQFEVENQRLHIAVELDLTGKTDALVQAGILSASSVSLSQTTEALTAEGYQCSEGN